MTAAFAGVKLKRTRRERTSRFGNGILYIVHERKMTRAVALETDIMNLCQPKTRSLMVMNSFERI